MLNSLAWRTATATSDNYAKRAIFSFIVYCRQIAL
jgi:hypothetical protein